MFHGCRNAIPRGALIGLCLSVLLLAGCGYKLVRAPTGAAAADRIAVAVPPLTNDSFDAGIGPMVTDALRREILRRGRLQLVDPGKADVVVAGRIRPIETFPTSVSSVGAALEHQIELEVDLRAERLDGTEVALANNFYREWELYLESADLEAARKNRVEALRRVAAVIAVQFHDVLSAGLEPPSP